MKNIFHSLLVFIVLFGISFSTCTVNNDKEPIELITYTIPENNFYQEMETLMEAAKTQEHANKQAKITYQGSLNQFEITILEEVE